jgi:HK97 family phage major capsid protein
MDKKGYTEILQLVDGNSQPLIQFQQGLQANPPMTLFGREIIVSGALSGAGDTLDDTTNANSTILFGTLQNVVAGTRQGLSWDVTDQVSWASYQMDARLVGRFGGVVGVPAAWTALTHITQA